MFYSISVRWNSLAFYLPAILFIVLLLTLSNTPVAAQAPSAPTGLAANGANSQVSLTWGTSAGATSYNVYRSTSTGTEGSSAYKTGLTSAAYTDTAVTNGLTYYYTVAAVNGSGTSAQSAEAHTIVDYATLTIPTLKGIAGNGQASLYWAAISGAASYTLYRCVNGTTTTSYQTGLTGTSYTDTGLSNSPTYYTYQVSATGSGSKSNLAYVTPSTTAASNALPPPSVISQAVDGDYVTIGLTFTKIDPATSYNIYRSTTPGGEGNAPYAAGVVPTIYSDYVDDNGVDGMTYYYEVAAVNNTGEGVLSPENAVLAPSLPLDFLVYMSPPVLTITHGTTISANFNILPSYFFASPVSLTLGTTPPGVTASLFPTVVPTAKAVNQNGQSGATIVFCASPAATTGSYYMSITGTSGSLTHTQWVHIIVN